ncbi:ATPase, AAA domain containing protein [Acanthamoeba castellanii str. Neff]|uniref:ATPase, AAA domain containing protein n=1 Tax=Acanthamoeba castellanii (strain ATCC 30010 / Neff) TaxID=1257118 RepID=L8GP61_ACACF|nr:ATPase, AAA domain containing protein [Acanthamoeba castellanii str. Neff]ELR14969.1 ATPase, AAA domain containing protein [Acanthamoeba castellanii str. Neff]
MEDKQQVATEASAAVDELQAKLKAQEDELAKLRQLNELLLERMNKKDKRSIKSLTSATAGIDGAADQQEYEAFDVKKVPVRHRETNEIIDHDHIVTVKDAQLIQYLRNWVHVDSLYAEPPTAKADELFQARNQLKQLVQLENVAELQGFLDTLYGDMVKRYDNMLAEGVISYRALWYLFTKGKKVVGKTDTNFSVGAEIVSSQYRGGIFPSFEVNGSVIKANGKEFYTTSQSFRVLPYVGTRKLEDLPLRLLDEKTEATITARGRKFARLAVGVHYQTYKGYVAQKEGWWGYQLYKADGRCMLDGVSFNRLNPNSRSADLGGLNQDQYNQQTNSFEAIPDEKLFMAWPTILGFSFSAKKWGEFSVAELDEVKFDDQAFHKLVLPEEKKVLIRSLVENSADFSDIISGKGGGCIFLLHGSPGVGKTLTAESVAELLHRPLYSVSVGELGTDTNELEKKLTEILEVSSSWNAVILLDEADVFLEKRTENDVKRNAMVGIFLRLLEYHQGVLFLTTNRVKCFDKAFHSRISVAIKYEDLGVDSRTQIWTTLLQVANISGIDPAELCVYDINGRQIRTIIRLALALAKTEGVPVNKTHLERTIKVALQFAADLEKAFE